MIGFDAVVKEIASPKLSNNFRGVVLAADVSAKTEKEVRFHSEKHGREVVKADFTMDEANDALGKRVGVFLISDEGLFGSIKKNISPLDDAEMN